METLPPEAPLTRDLTLVYVLSIVVAALMAVMSVAGLLFGSVGLYGFDRTIVAGVATGPAGVLVPGFVGQDALNLLLGTPTLLGSMWLARRGFLIGLLLWPGMLFNVLYTDTHYLVGAPFSVLFLGYASVAALSAFVLIGLIASIDGDAVRRRLAGTVPARTVGGVLVGLALLTVAQDSGGAVATAVAGGSLTAPEAHRVWIADLAMAAPAMLIAGVLLWRHVALGYVAGAGLLLSFSIFSAELAVMLALQPQLTGSPVDAGTITGLTIFAAAGLGPLAFFVRGARGDKSAALRTGRQLASTSVRIP